jgi:hypothetical protein
VATGAGPFYLALVFNIDHTNAMAYANAARNLLTSPAGQAPSRRPNKHQSTPGTRADADSGRYGR